MEAWNEFWENHFPKTPEEAKDWEPYVLYRALHTNVLCAAKSRIEGAWSAYCRNVPGYDHLVEHEDVLQWGNKLPRRVAVAMFPEFESVPYDS